MGRTFQALVAACAKAWKGDGQISGGPKVQLWDGEWEAAYGGPEWVHK